MAKCKHGNYPGVDCSQCDEAYKAACMSLQELELQRSESRAAYEAEKDRLQKMEVLARSAKYNGSVQWNPYLQQKVDELLSELQHEFVRMESWPVDSEAQEGLAALWVAVMERFYPEKLSDLRVAELPARDVSELPVCDAQGPRRRPRGPRVPPAPPGLREPW